MLTKHAGKSPVDLQLLGVRYRSPITLDEPKVQFENSVGQLVLDEGSSLEPGKATP